MGNNDAGGVVEEGENRYYNKFGITRNTGDALWFSYEWPNQQPAFKFCEARSTGITNCHYEDGMGSEREKKRRIAATIWAFNWGHDKVSVLPSQLVFCYVFFSFYLCCNFRPHLNQPVQLYNSEEKKRPFWTFQFQVQCITYVSVLHCPFQGCRATILELEWFRNHSTAGPCCYKAIPMKM